MKKILLFPFNIHCSEILRYRHLVKKYDVVGAVAPIGWGISGKDISFVDGGVDTGIYVQDRVNYDDDFDSILVVAECGEESPLQSVIFDYVQEALEHGKEVIFTSAITEKLEELCSKYPQLLSFDMGEVSLNKKAEKLLDISTPVIMVTGMHELTHKLKIQLEIRQYFQEKGYIVSHIASKKYGSVFGAHAFPQFMFSEIAESKKIYGFNNFVRQIEKTEQPDVIIIGVSGEIMPYNNKYPGHFGITLYEVMQAVQPDALIVSCLYERYNNAYFQKLAESIQHKYGVCVDGFNVSTFQVDYNETEQNHSLQYFRSTYREVDNVLKECSVEIPIYNVMNGVDGEKMAEMVYEKLARLGEAESV